MNGSAIKNRIGRTIARVMSANRTVSLKKLSCCLGIFQNYIRQFACIQIFSVSCTISLMAIYIVGLGNPGEEYKNTRHNVGREFLETLRKRGEFSEWKENKKTRARESSGVIGKIKVTLALPETFMNESGKAVGRYVVSKKSAEKLLVVHDDLDLPIGRAKISFNKSSGGHRGVESIIKSLKTEGFARLRVGISPSTPSGKLKKPTGEEKVLKFILGKFSDKECEILKKEFKKFSEAAESFALGGAQKMMSEWNREL